MRILVTGGAGFIGSAVVRRAIELGHDICNLDALTYASSLSNLNSVSQSRLYRFEHGDIIDHSLVRNVINDFEPSAVIHLAAESHVDRSIGGPMKFVATNVVGTANLLEAWREYWVKKGEPTDFRFLHVSTDEVFGSLPNDRSIKFTEETKYDPRSPYSASKAGSDHLVRAWFHTYNMPIIISNCSNNYGPFQFPEKLLPVVIINALRGKDIPIYGDGSHIRDWLFVDDHASALFSILEHGVLGESYNVGGNNELTNYEIVHLICKIMNEQINSGFDHRELIKFVSDRPGHDTRYAIDALKIETELSWVPSTSLETGLEATVEWYLNNEGWWKPLLDRLTSTN